MSCAVPLHRPCARSAFQPFLAPPAFGAFLTAEDALPPWQATLALQHGTSSNAPRLLHLGGVHEAHFRLGRESAKEPLANLGRKARHVQVAGKLACEDDLAVALAEGRCTRERERHDGGKGEAV